MIMNNLLVEIYVPSIGCTFDIFIPKDAKIFELLPLISTAVTRLSDEMFMPNDVVLCNGKVGMICSRNSSVGDMKLKNGSRLMLI